MVHPTQPFVFISRQITFLSPFVSSTQTWNSIILFGQSANQFYEVGFWITSYSTWKVCLNSIFSACFNCNISAGRYCSQAQNYKSVSLMPMPGKIMDQILLETIVKHMLYKDVMGDSKHGFSKGKLCLKSLVAFYDGYGGSGWGKSDRHPAVLVQGIYTVPHDIHVSKLERYGFDGKSTPWIKNCVDGCTQSCGRQRDVQVERSDEETLFLGDRC